MQPVLLESSGIRHERYSRAMSTLQEVERAVRHLSAEDLTAFRAWFAAYDAEVWDRQLEEDVRAGRLDRLADEALREHRAGRTTAPVNHRAPSRF